MSAETIITGRSGPGWQPWIPQAPGLQQSPYSYDRVEIHRDEWDKPRTVGLRDLSPELNVAGLWWRPVEPLKPPVDTSWTSATAGALSAIFGGWF